MGGSPKSKTMNEQKPNPPHPPATSKDINQDLIINNEKGELYEWKPSPPHPPATSKENNEDLIIVAEKGKLDIGLNMWACR